MTEEQTCVVGDSTKDIFFDNVKEVVSAFEELKTATDNLNEKIEQLKSYLPIEESDENPKEIVGGKKRRQTTRKQRKSRKQRKQRKSRKY